MNRTQGRGVDQSEEEAERWLRRAATAGHAHATHKLGHLRAERARLADEASAALAGGGGKQATGGFEGGEGGKLAFFSGRASKVGCSVDVCQNRGSVGPVLCSIKCANDV